MRTIVFRSLYWVPHLGKLPYGDTSIIIRGLYMVSWRLPCQDYQHIGDKIRGLCFWKAPHAFPSYSRVLRAPHSGRWSTPYLRAGAFWV